MSAIEVKDIVSFNRRKLILDKVSFTVPHGSVTALVGNSSAGKMTVLRCIAGTEVINSGKIFVNSKSVEELTPGKRGVALISQTDGLLPHLSIAENIAFPLKLSGYNRQQRKKCVAEISEKMGLSTFLNKKPREISKEDRYYVSLARARIRNPLVYLFEGSTSKSIFSFQKILFSELLRLKKEKTSAAIITTDDCHSLESCIDQMVIMHAGEVIQSGLPSVAFENPQKLFVTSYHKNSKINLLKAKVSKLTNVGLELKFKGGRIIPVAGEYKELLLGDIITVGIWPENVHYSIEPISGAIKARILGIGNTGSFDILELKSEIGKLHAAVKKDIINGQTKEVWIKISELKSIIFFPDGSRVK